MSLKRSGSARELEVFFCYSSRDKHSVRRIYEALMQVEGLRIWMDEESLLPGQDWATEISAAVRATDVVVIFFSREAVAARGFIQRELRLALDVAELQPEGQIFIIPVKINACDVPEKFRHLHYVNLYEERGFGRFLNALESRARTLGISLRRSSFNVSGDPIEMLRDRLMEGDFREADQLTAYIMLSVAERLQEGWLDSESSSTFPCDVLLLIDSLWVTFSQGRFGFSVQRRIWEEIGGQLEAAPEFCTEFSRRVGWMQPGPHWPRWGELNFSLSAPDGHLPTPPRWWELWDEFKCGEQLILYRLDSCGQNWGTEDEK